MNYLVRSSQALSPRSSSLRSLGTPPVLLPALGCAKRQPLTEERVEIGGLYYKNQTRDGVDRRVRDWHLMVLIADGDCFMYHAGHERLLVLILRFLEGALPVVS